MDDRLEELLDRCLLLDLETGWDGAIHKIGAIRCGSNFSRQGRFEQQAALAELDAFAADADFLLGHNLLGHDLPCLRTLSPGLDLLRLPVIDSLYLSPLAFPENPYHRLVKDYKLVRDGLSAPENKRIQDAFIAGELQVICATNAFGMGVDKEDVRLVVHLDIPGSLENYVQEAGRAGRGRLPALCVLLYDEQDLEGQFRMEAMSELTLLAVGDDDQNIYAFRGASLTFIRRFLTDYDAAPHYLVENYRSTANVIQAGNALISNNRERMKTDRPIRIDRRRRGQPPGGRWETLDPLARGRVLVLDAADPGLQAAALVARIRQLRQLRGGAWTDFALLARTRGVLEPIRALCESERIPVAWREDLPPLHRVREIADFVDRLRSMGQEPCMAESLGSLLPEHVGPWRRLLERLRCPW